MTRTVAHHPSVSSAPGEPCPFCGCGKTLTAHKARVSRSRKRAFVPYDRSGDAFGTLPADWAFPLGVGATLSAADQEAMRKADAYIAKHRGMVPVIDEKRNTISGWRPAAGSAESEAA